MDAYLQGLIATAAAPIIADQRDEALNRAEAAEAEVVRLRKALELARHYVVKGIEQGAYTGCVMSGYEALDRIDDALHRPVE